MNLEPRRTRKPSVFIIPARITAFLEHQSLLVSPGWLQEQRRYLMDWHCALRPRVSFQSPLLPVRVRVFLAGRGARVQQLSTLQRFCSWLVEIETLTPAENQLEGWTLSQLLLMGS
jgi:hypothetical protein